MRDPSGSVSQAVQKVRGAVGRRWLSWPDFACAPIWPRSRACLSTWITRWLKPAVVAVVDELERHELVARELQRRQAAELFGRNVTDHLVPDGGVEDERPVHVGNQEAVVQGSHESAPSGSISPSAPPHVGRAVKGVAVMGALAALFDAA